MVYNLRFVSTYRPRRCGIGTYTENLATGCSKHGIFGDIRVTAVCGEEPSEEYGIPVDLTIKQDNPVSWDEGISATIREAKRKDAIIIIQHEFGIAIHEGCDYFVRLAEEAKKAGLTVITYLHTVPSKPSEYEMETITSLDDSSDCLVVHTESAKKRLENAPYSIDPFLVEQIHHGVRIYNPRDVDRLEIKKKLGMENLMLVSSLGMRGPNKGDEYSIRAYARFLESLTKSQRDDIIYLIAGACHPDFVNYQSGILHEEFEEMIRDTLSDCKLRSPKEYEKSLYGVDWRNNDVVIVDEFLLEDNFLRIYGATNAMLMLYPDTDQISSGILADTLGTGRVAVATKFDYAREMLHPNKVKEKGIVGMDNVSLGGLVDPKEPSVNQAAEFLDYLMIEGECRGRDVRLSMEQRAHRLGYNMRWDNCAWDLGRLIDFIESRKIRETHRGIIFERKTTPQTGKKR